MDDGNSPWGPVRRMVLTRENLETLRSALNDRHKNYGDSDALALLLRVRDELRMLDTPTDSDIEGSNGR